MPGSEKGSFNSLNIAHAGNYSKLSSLFKKYGSWDMAWRDSGSKTPDPLSALRELERHGVELILQDDPSFPPILREIPHPPHALYIKGILAPLENAIGIVGTRKATDHGKALAFDFGKYLAGRNISVVSGLAFGIDKAAHEGALAAEGKTMAILANGLDAIYPASHRTLGEKIVTSGGALISEYPLYHKPLPYHFLQRNRIISGLTKGVLVVEAPRESGSLATARFALDQNREVFVIPGSPRHPNYAGSHDLIRHGAMLVSDPAHILESFGLADENTPEAPGVASFGEQAIIGALRNAGRPIDIEELSERTGLPVSEINQALSFLIIQSKVKEHGTGFSL